MNAEHLAKEAHRLLNDETLLHAIAEAQRESKDALVTADVDNKTEILRLQANVQAFDSILTQLEMYVIRRGQNSETLTGPLA